MVKQTPKTISELYLEHQQSFLKHLKKAKGLNREEIHKMRVETKRLRSLFRLLNRLGGKKSDTKRALKLILPVFKSAGEMRDTSQNKKLARQFKEPMMKGFKEYLNGVEKKQGEKLRLEIKNFSKKKYRRSNTDLVMDFKKLDHDHVEKRSKEYLQKLMDRVKTFIPDINNDETFHEIRKRLKDIKTVDQLLNDLYPEKTAGKLLSKVKNIEQRIGSWHDRIMLIEEIEKYLKKVKRKSDKVQFAAIIAGIKSRNEKSKQDIAKQLGKLQIAH